MTTVIPGVGPQHERAASGEDERGELVFEYLPAAIDDAENSTSWADYERWRLRPRTFQRSATPTEIALLAHLGHAIPADLVTEVEYRSRGLRHRSWPQIETQEKTPCEPIADATWSQEPPEPAAVSDETESADTAAPDDDELDPRIAKLKREAQSLRARLRESEDGRASDLAKLAAYEQQAIERAAAQVLADPADLLRLADEDTVRNFNDEFGQIIENQVIAAAHKLASERPHLAKHAFPPPSNQPVEGLRPGASPAPEKPKTPSWSEALHGLGG